MRRNVVSVCIRTANVLESKRPTTENKNQSGGGSESVIHFEPMATGDQFG